MEAVVGFGGATSLLRARMLCVRNLECSAHLLSRTSSKQVNIFNPSCSRFTGSFASSEGEKLFRIQSYGVRRVESFRVSAKVGEETESTQESAGTTADSTVKGKGFGTTKPLTEKKKKSSSPPPSSTRRVPPQNPLIGTQVDEETKNFETAAVGALIFVFSLIILEGIGLAASGFLPEEWDDFMVKVTYPAFTPTVGVFLGGAAAYGVWKYFGGGEKKGPTSK